MSREAASQQFQGRPEGVSREVVMREDQFQGRPLGVSREVVMRWSFFVQGAQWAEP